MEKLKIVNKYYHKDGVNGDLKYSHEYSDTVSITDIVCPKCGAKGKVWVAYDSDYYVGESHYCIECYTTFTMPTFWTLDKVPDDDRQCQLAQTIKQIKEALNGI
jgi:hypothetical protein